MIVTSINEETQDRQNHSLTKGERPSRTYNDITLFDTIPFVEVPLEKWGMTGQTDVRLSRLEQKILLMQKKPTVFIVDDEPRMRTSLVSLLKSADYQTKAYESAKAFLDDYNPDLPGCLIVDLRMEGMNGLELQAEFSTRGIRIPHIFISGYADVTSAVEAIKAGAIDFLEKPFRERELFERIQQAIEQDSKNRQGDAERERIQTLLKTLSPRERQVSTQLVRGQSAKQIALAFGISSKTVDVHRARVLEKM